MAKMACISFQGMVFRETRRNHGLRTWSVDFTGNCEEVTEQTPVLEARIQRCLVQELGGRANRGSGQQQERTRKREDMTASQAWVRGS